MTEYAPAISALAQSMNGWGGAEVADLEQEGRIAVWQSLQRGVTPSNELIKDRMIAWTRWLRRQPSVPYESMLPMDDYSGLTAW